MERVREEKISAYWCIFSSRYGKTICGPSIIQKLLGGERCRKWIILKVYFVR